MTGVNGDRASGGPARLLEGKSAVVTGGSRGIGLAVARSFAEHGANVLITSRKEDKLAEAVASIREVAVGQVLQLAGNAGDHEHAERCLVLATEQFGRVDVLVNNAATNPYHGPITEISPQQATKTADVNYLSVLRWSQLAWQTGMSSAGGTIINMASTGALSVEHGIGFYNTTKAALVHLTKHLALDMSPGVRVNAIAPGLIKTDMARALWEENEAELARIMPLQRLGEPRDIANAALFLASDMASWITGHTLVVDGGVLVKSIV